MKNRYLFKNYVYTNNMPFLCLIRALICVKRCESMDLLEFKIVRMSIFIRWNWINSLGNPSAIPNTCSNAKKNAIHKTYVICTQSSGKHPRVNTQYPQDKTHLINVRQCADFKVPWFGFFPLTLLLYLCLVMGDGGEEKRYVSLEKLSFEREALFPPFQNFIFRRP